MSEESIDELFTAALKGDREDDAAWAAVKKLHFIGSEEVLERSVGLTRSSDAATRERGADLLGQLGVKPGLHSTSFVPQRLEALLALLKHETDPGVLHATIIALGHLGDPDGIRAVLRFCDHHDEDVRYAVAWSLPTGLGKEIEAIHTLMRLMSDTDSDVRDWATFGLGTQSDADSTEIREALFERLADADEDTRAEAVVGLSKRMDLRALPVVLAELEKDEYGVLYEEAASFLLGLDGETQEDWQSWRYVEELRARFNVSPMQPDLPLQ